MMLLSLPNRSLAGGGPENLLLVVNQNSDASKTIANHYIHLRKIPASNVLYLDWEGGNGTIKGERFREEILKPVLATIERRRLAMQISTIAYSVDFPWRVDFRGDLDSLDEKASPAFKKQFRPLASLNGATYLWAYAIRKNAAMVIPGVNWYLPKAAGANDSACRDCAGVVTRGFSPRYLLKKGGRRSTDPKKGQRYFLSTLLGITVERGNTVDEIVANLTRSSAVDGRHPKGTFYFMKNGDIRSKTRHACFNGIVESLKAEGASARIVNGVAPKNVRDVLGLMAGSAKVPLKKNHVSFVPGAIGEHLTSYGGDYSNPYHTKLSEFIREGASGASGAVAEPYAIQAKFPLPSIHLHYRRGCSLAEAFYQAVSSPYQLLIVGDPLCQPWAKPPEVTLEGIESGETIQGVVKITTKAQPKFGTEAGKCNLFVDGRLVVAKFPPALALSLNTSGLTPGHHEIRVVCATADLIECQGRAILTFRATGDQVGGEVLLSADSKNRLPFNSLLRLRLSGPLEAARLEVMQSSRVVASIEKASMKQGSGEVDIPVAQLGRGPVTLWGRAMSEAVEEGEPEKELGRSASSSFLVE